MSLKEAPLKVLGKVAPFRPGVRCFPSFLASTEKRCVCFRKLVVDLGAPRVSAFGRFIPGRGVVPSPDAQSWDSLGRVQDLHLLLGHFLKAPGAPAQSEELHLKPRILPLPHFPAWSVSSSQVNERAGQIIRYDKFYIHELDELIDIRHDYVTWIQRQMYPLVSDVRLLVAPPSVSLLKRLSFLTRVTTVW